MDDVTVIVPVGAVHVGSVTLTVGAAGALGADAMVTSIVVVQPALFFTVMVCLPELSPVYPPVGYGANAPPSKLNSTPVVGEVIVMIPVDVVQVGSVTLAVGAGGAPGAPATVTSILVVQPALFFTANVCLPVPTPVNPPAG